MRPSMGALATERLSLAAGRLLTENYRGTWANEIYLKLDVDGIRRVLGRSCKASTQPSAPYRVRFAMHRYCAQIQIYCIFIHSRRGRIHIVKLMSNVHFITLIHIIVTYLKITVCILPRRD